MVEDVILTEAVVARTLAAIAELEVGVVRVGAAADGALVAIGGLSILATEFKTPAKVRDVSIKGLKAATAKAKELNEKRMAASTDPDN